MNQCFVGSFLKKGYVVSDRLHDPVDEGITTNLKAKLRSALSRSHSSIISHPQRSKTKTIYEDV